MFSVALGLMWVWVLQLVGAVGSQIILGVRNRQDQRGQQDRWGRLKLKTPLEWGPAGVGHGGVRQLTGCSCVVPQRSPRDLIRLR